MANHAAVRLSADEARRFLVAWHGLDVVQGRGPEGIPALLDRLGCIQLDPLDRIGTNADLVVLARLDGVRRGDVYRALLPGRAFEHFAKERCLLPASSWPAWRATRLAASWWRDDERLERVDEALIADVLAELAERGPCGVDALRDRGEVDPLDWSGWKGTRSATRMAVEVLWRRCDAVVAGREGNHKLWDVPHRSLAAAHALPAPALLARWMVTARVRAAGLLSATAGVWWSGLRHLRADVASIVDPADVVPVEIEGVRRRFWAPPEVETLRAEPDDRVRVLGPLDPLLWDRDLVEAAFGFAYVWEVYKPAAQRRWGWYVVPLLHRGQLIGRMEARVDEGRMVVDRLWRERPDWDEAAVEEALGRHAAALGVSAPAALPA